MAVTFVKTVRPTPKWQEMYILARQGRRLILEANGTWSPDLRNTIGWCGPDGIINRIADEGYVLPGCNVGALVGKIGDGEPFAVGAYYDFRPLNDGTLHLAMNENSAYTNQAGALTVTIIAF